MYTVDLHCDLLSHPTFSPLDPSVRCSPGQLKEAQVLAQVCALFSETGSNSVASMQEQNKKFFFCEQQYPFMTAIPFSHEGRFRDQEIAVIRAIENASGLALEEDPLSTAVHRLHQLFQEGPLAYVGLVWNHGNRFGGGTFENRGLTEDGKVLLEVLEQLCIPVDLSHACLRLVEDVLDYIADKKTKLVPIASHSNFNSVCEHPRNLQDDHAKEIARRGGVIGLNMVKAFIGDVFSCLSQHIAKAEALGISNSLCIGSDFFYSAPSERKFFEECQTALDHYKIREVILKTLDNKAQQVLEKTASNFIAKIVQQQTIKRDLIRSEI